MKAYLVALIGWVVFVGIAWAIIDGTERVADKRRRFRVLTHVGIALLSAVAILGFGVLAVVIIPILVIFDRVVIRNTRFCDRVGHVVTETFGTGPITQCPHCGAPVH